MIRLKINNYLIYNLPKLKKFVIKIKMNYKNIYKIIIFCVNHSRVELFEIGYKKIFILNVIYAIIIYIFLTFSISF